MLKSLTLYILLIHIFGALCASAGVRDTTQLKEVVVTAKENAGVVTSSKIGRDAMSHLQPSSFTDLLELLPGNMAKVPVMGEANTIQLRETGTLGATGTASNNADYSISSLGTLFVVDGAPLNTDANMQSLGITSDPSSPDYTRNITNKGVDMRTIATDNIENVEIVRGIPSAEYGNLTSGMVNIKRIYRATPLTARFKADEWSKLFYIGKGIEIHGAANVINVDVGYMDSKVDPRNNLEGYKRLTGSLRYSGYRNLHSTVWRYKIGMDYTGSFDNAKTDSDLSNGKIDLYKSSYQRFSIGVGAHFTFSLHPLLTGFDVNASVSAQYDVLERHKQVAPSRPSAAPTTMAEGVHDGHFLLGEYLADYRSEGKPLTAFVKGAVTGRWQNQWWEMVYKTGVEWYMSKNYGDGQIYDLMRPLSASWTSRPRCYADIPALHTLAFFVQDMNQIDTKAGQFDIQLGLRGSALAGLDSRYYLSGRIYLDPRVNLLWHLPSIGNVRPYIGGGYGLTTKMPTSDYLFPQAHYNDIVQLNYYDIAHPTQNSRLNLRTYIDDATNYGLRAARNRKFEFRLGATYKGNVLSITYFDERMNSGFRYSNVYAPYSYYAYDASAIIPNELTGPPVLENLPFSPVTILEGYRKVTNGSRIVKQGVEFTLNTVRWRALCTSLIVNGAWFKSTYTNSQMLYSPVTDVVNGIAVSDRYVGLYDYNDGRVNEQFNTNFMFDTQISRLGLIFTTSVQCMWFVKTTLLPKDGVPTAYISAEDGNLHSYTEESALNLALRTLIKTYNPDQFKTVKIAPAVYLNLKASKQIGRLLRVSLFVNSILDWLPDYEMNGITIRRHADPYFGMELNLTI